MRILHLLLRKLLLGLVLVCPAAAQEIVTVTTNTYHLGVEGNPEWESFKNKKVDGRRLNLSFPCESNAEPWILLIHQDDVKQEWGVELNGRPIGKLFLMEERLVHSLPIPAGRLLTGTNQLSITPSKEADDIVIGPIQILKGPRFSRPGRIHVSVGEPGAGKRPPCRLTITDAQGWLAPLQVEAEPGLAVRPGVVYTLTGKADIGVLPGNYTLFATRGFEYGLGQAQFSMSENESREILVTLTREVATEGLISCDPHIHTLTHSGHGDCTLEERIITIAGEGIELPVATDHNFLTDYLPVAARLGALDFFTPVVGDEVTTPVGHFNVFPVLPGSRVPEFRLTNGPGILRSIRATPGARVAVLNHPRDLHSDYRPFGPPNFNPISGEQVGELVLSVDAVELINSGALRTDCMEVYRDWFAVLNSGRRIVGVAASDSHDVSRFIVGQGRTYIRSDAADPARIEVDLACDNLLQGRVLVSMGLLTDLIVEDKFRAGDLATNLPRRLSVRATVASPSWIQADRIALFVNGEEAHNQPIVQTRNESGGRLAVVQWTIDRPEHDCFLVAIATGPGVEAPYWKTPRPYQPTSITWNPRVAGSNNPIWIDGDGDGRYSPAREYAIQIQNQAMSLAHALALLTQYDSSVAIQYASLLRQSGMDLQSSAFQFALRDADARVRGAISLYGRTVESNSKN